LQSCVTLLDDPFTVPETADVVETWYLVLPNATGLTKIKSFATEAECRAGTIRGLSDTHPQPQNDPMFNYRSAVGLITVNRAEVQQARRIPGDDPRLPDGPE
jgi:hypothetical protein